MEGTKICPYCGEEILATAKKCKHCGEWLPTEPQSEKIICPVCAEVIDAGVAICPLCNEPIRPDAQSAREQASSAVNTSQKGPEFTIKEQPSKGGFGKIILSIVALILIGGIALFTVGGENGDDNSADNSNDNGLYVYEDSEWKSNSDKSCYYAVASDDKRDLQGGELELYGMQYIVASDKPSGKVRKIISAADLTAIDPNVGTNVHFELFPSTIDSNLLYFNYMVSGLEYTSSGKLNCETGEIQYTGGPIIGMLSEGSFKGYYVKVELGSVDTEDGAKIVPQSAEMGEEPEPVLVFDLNDVMEGHQTEELLFDKNLAAELLKMIESENE